MNAASSNQKSHPHPRLALQMLGMLALLFGLGIWHAYGLSHRGLLEHDEGHNLLAARTYSDVIRWLSHGGPWQSSTAELAKLKETLHRQGGTLYPAGKPGYIIGLAIVSFATGLSQIAALGLSWIAGMLVICFAGLIARRLYGASLLPQAIATIGVGLSPLLGYLSREAGGTIWSVAFGTGAFLLLISIRLPSRCARLRAFAVGLLFGYGFTCHYNLLPAIAAALAADLTLFSSSTGLPVRSTFALRARTYLFVLVGIMFIVGSLQLATMAAEHKLRPIHPKYQNYFAELTHIVGVYQLPALRGEPVGEGVRGWGMPAIRYIARVAWHESLGFVPVVFFAFLICARCCPGKKLLLPSIVFLTVNACFWILHPWKVERSWGMVSVSIWLLTAGLVHIITAEIQRSPDWIRILGVVALVGLSGATLKLAAAAWIPLWTARSPISTVASETLAYVATHGGRIGANSAATSFAPLWKWSIIENSRLPQLQPALRTVDFSSFDKPDIVFTDPNTATDPIFPVTPVQLSRLMPLAKATSTNPAWHIAAYDLRTQKSE